MVLRMVKLLQLLSVRPLWPLLQLPLIALRQKLDHHRLLAVWSIIIIIILLQLIWSHFVLQVLLLLLDTCFRLFFFFCYLSNIYYGLIITVFFVVFFFWRLNDRYGWMDVMYHWCIIWNTLCCELWVMLCWGTIIYIITAIVRKKCSSFQL